MEVFDRLDHLKKEIGTDPKKFIADLTVNSFHSSNELKIHGFDGDCNRNNLLIGSAAPLLKIFTSIDSACDFFHFHSDFLEVSLAFFALLIICVRVVSLFFIL